MNRHFGHMAIMTIAVIGLTGCGYELRRHQANLGATNSSSNHHAHSLQLSVGDTQAQRIMHEQLRLMGYQIIHDPKPTTTVVPTIDIQHLTMRRYELLGVLTEIRLILSADVYYQINDQTHQHTLQATRSYQYNKAGIGASDTEHEQVKRWLYQELARKVGEQYRVLLQNNHAQDTL